MGQDRDTFLKYGLDLGITDLPQLHNQLSLRSGLYLILSLVFFFCPIARDKGLFLSYHKGLLTSLLIKF